MARWVDAQGQVTSAKKTQKHPHWWHHPSRTPNPKLKKNFQSKLEDLPNPQVVWTPL